MPSPRRVPVPCPGPPAKWEWNHLNGPGNRWDTVPLQPDGHPLSSAPRSAPPPIPSQYPPPPQPAAALRADMDLSLIHISEPTRRTPISYAVFCLKKKKKQKQQQQT